MSHAVGDENVGNDDLGRVDEDTFVVDGNLYRASLESGNRLAVAQSAAVADGAIDDVVLQNGSELLGGKSGDQVRNAGEGTVLRGEDGDILESGVSVERLPQRTLEVCFSSCGHLP